MERADNPVTLGRLTSIFVLALTVLFAAGCGSDDSAMVPDRRQRDYGRRAAM